MPDPPHCHLTVSCMDYCVASLLTDEDTEAHRGYRHLMARSWQSEGMNTGLSASRTISVHRVQLPLTDLSSWSQGLPVASTSGSLSPVPSDILQWLPSHRYTLPVLVPPISVAHATYVPERLRLWIL